MERNLSRNEMMVEDGLSYTKVDAEADLAKIHNVYRDMLGAYVKSCVTNQQTPSIHEIEVAMEGVGESLANKADRPLEFLPYETYIPADAEKLIRKAHDSMVDALKIKNLNWPATFDVIFRPQPTRGTSPQNPATLAAKGAL